MMFRVPAARAPYRGLLGLFAVCAALASACTATSGPPVAATPAAPTPQASAIAAGPGAPAAASNTASHSQAVVPVLPSDPQWGAADAPVTLVEFGDFQCPFTARVAPVIAQLKLAYGSKKLHVVWKHLPLPFHAQAKPVHEASARVQAAGGSDAFFKFAASVLQNQQNLNPAEFEGWATQAGVPSERFRSSSAPNAAADVDRDVKLSAELGMEGTPGFLVNGVKISGAQPYEKFREVIDQQLLEAEKLARAGTPAGEIYPLLAARNFSAPQPEKNAPEEEEEDRTVWKVQVLADDPVRGPSDALVTIVQWSDFQCPFCKRVEPTLERLLADNPKDVRLVWKDNPLPFHPRAVPSALLARQAFERGGNVGFWRMHAALFESAPKLEDEDLERLAKSSNLDWARVNRAMQSSTPSPKIEQSIDQATDLEARGVPHFFINGVRLSGAQPLEAFQELVDAQLARARELLSTGVARRGVYEALLKDGKEATLPDRVEVPAPDAKSPSRGPVNAPIVIQQWSDFQCPFCSRVLPTLSELEKTYPGKLRIVWRHLPLPFHKDAPLAAEAAQEAFQQKGAAAFWRFHDRLFAEQAGGIQRPVLDALAKELGLDMKRFAAALDSHAHAAKVQADADAAQAAGIRGTPAFAINGYLVSGAQPTRAFKRVIGRLLAQPSAKPAVTKGKTP